MILWNMSKARINIKTDNSFLREKVNLRLESLPDKSDVKVLECFAGDGKIWNQVKKRTGKKIDILKIEMKKGKKGTYLQGDNMKYLGGLTLELFDIVHVTLIQKGLGRINSRLLYDLGYTKGMVQKVPTLFGKNGFEKVKQWLALKGVNKIKFITKKTRMAEKNYFWFEITG